jgi:hypothetical protein
MVCGCMQRNLVHLCRVAAALFLAISGIPSGASEQSLISKVGYFNLPLAEKAIAENPSIALRIAKELQEAREIKRGISVPLPDLTPDAVLNQRALQTFSIARRLLTQKEYDVLKCYVIKVAQIRGLVVEQISKTANVAAKDANLNYVFAEDSVFSGRDAMTRNGMNVTAQVIEIIEASKLPDRE